MTLIDEVLQLVESYEGKTEQKKNNADWLLQLMKDSGNPTSWQVPEPYCIAAALSVWNVVLQRHNLKLPFIPSKSTQTCYDNAKQKGFVGAEPSVGDIVIFRKGDGWQGHAGIVTKVLSDRICTTEFNTSSNHAGNQRDGEGCYARTRLFKDFQKSSTRLWIRGYIKLSRLVKLQETPLASTGTTITNQENNHG